MHRVSRIPRRWWTMPVIAGLMLLSGGELLGHVAGQRPAGHEGVVWCEGDGAVIGPVCVRIEGVGSDIGTG